MSHIAVKVDYKKLSQFIKGLDKLNPAEIEKMEIAAVKELAARMLAEVTQNTPVLSGRAKGLWTVTDVVKYNGYYEIKVINTEKKYIEYVEKGHRQQVGRYVPAIGKRLVNPFVKGQFFMKLSAEKIDKQASAIVEKYMRDYLKDVFK